MDSYFDETAQPEQKEGICPKCLGTHFMIAERNGALGAVYVSTSQDSTGKPIKRLLTCECSINVDF